jgi:hypothetical protein
MGLENLRRLSGLVDDTFYGKEVGGKRLLDRVNSNAFKP